jgi:hypothetical protein
MSAYRVRETATGFIVVGPSGALLRDGGAGHEGEPLAWRDRSRAEAKAEWLNAPDRYALSNRERRELRTAIGARHGLPYHVARGLLD